MLTAQSGITAADRGALPLLEAEHKVRGQRGWSQPPAQDTQPVLEKDMVLKEILERSETWN